MKILFLEKDSTFDRSARKVEDFSHLGDIEIDNFQALDDPIAITKRIQGFDIIATNKAIINRYVIENSPDLKYIAQLATGYDNIDLEACEENNVLVSNIPGYGSESVAQHAMALLLEITNNVGYHTKRIKEGGWQEDGNWQYIERQPYHLPGKTLGIIGFGHIGQQMGRIAQAMGMKILANKRTPIPEMENEHLKFCSIDELFEKSDVISIHAPGNDQTRALINKDNIGKMKDGVIIINTGRGNIIVEEDLYEGLRSGKIYGAGLDVFNSEPIENENPLLTLDNCFLTGHMASATEESYTTLIDIGMDNIEKFTQGKPQNLVGKGK